MTRAAAALLLVAGLSVLGSAALAAPVQVQFEGVVETVSGHAVSPARRPLSPAEIEALLGGAIQVGTLFSGTIEYDDSAIAHDGYPETEGGPSGPAPAWGYYGSPGASHGEIGGFSGDGDGASISIYDYELYLEGPSTVDLATSFDAPPAPGEMVLYLVTLFLEGAAPGGPLHGTSLDSIPWDLESFPSARVEWLLSDGTNYVLATGSLTALAPEPGGLHLVALGACALLAARRGLARI